MATLLEQLDAMLTLKPNWDGYNADVIRPEAVRLAKEFVVLIRDGQPGRSEAGMHVTPGRDGGVLVEWADATHEHEVEVNQDGSVGFLHTSKTDGSMTERRYPPGRFAVVPGLLSEFRSSAA